MYMRIISWNVNGLRALVRQDYWRWLLERSPDTFLLQETKAHKEQLPDNVAAPVGYYAYFNAPKEKRGYSGVATYSKREPEDVIYELDNGKLAEYGRAHGRLITVLFDGFAVVNVYVPNGASETAPLDYKLQYYEALLEHATELRDDGYTVIVGGDINVAHEPIDLARPKGNEGNIGFLPEERAWIDEFERAGFVDVFRHLYPEKEEIYTYWDLRTRARERNVGWRLDYFLISSDGLPHVKDIIIYNDVYGSDHCPIELIINL